MRGSRRARFKAAVYEGREGMNNATRVVLLRLSDDMTTAGIVSVPRSKLAADLGVHPSRISEAVARARKLGFLDTVRRGRPGVTAVYQALVPPSQGVRPPGGDMVRHGAPPESPTWCAIAVSQEGNASLESESTPSHQARNEAGNTEADHQAVPNLRVVS